MLICFNDALRHARMPTTLTSKINRVHPLVTVSAEFDEDAHNGWIIIVHKVNTWHTDRLTDVQTESQEGYCTPSQHVGRG